MSKETSKRYVSKRLTWVEVEVFACEENMRKQSSHWQHHTWSRVHKCTRAHKGTSVLRYWNQMKVLDEGNFKFR